MAGKFLELLFTDYDSAAEMMSEDFVWDNLLPEHVPFGRSYKGANEMKIYVDELAANWVLGEIVFHDYIYDPETKILAVPGVEKNATSKSTGRSCDMDFIWEFRFTNDGKISYVREYNDTFAIAGTFDN